MKTFLCFLFLIMWSLSAQSSLIPFAFWRASNLGQWTWIWGSNIQEQQGRPGTRGTGSTANWPGQRNGSYTWTDSSGVFWLYGGDAYEQGVSGQPSVGCMGDLWKYDPSTAKWTWMTGSSGRWESPTYGTKGTAAAANTPGCRMEGSSWIDASDNLWLFGGSTTGGLRNDLWKYNPATNQWTWISGSNSVNANGAYGTKGTGSTANSPGARYLNLRGNWVGSDGKFYLFGGNGYDSVGSWAPMNDLWSFDPTTSKWTWVSGSNTVNQNATYGTKGTGSTSNIPGARNGAVGWADGSGFLWLLGGSIRDGSGSTGWGNDLWKFEIATGKWTWMTGLNGTNQGGTYGTQGTAAAANVPGARDHASGRMDSTGKFWLVAGNGYDSNASYGYLNDIWKYDPTTGYWTWISGSKLKDQTDAQSGTYGTQGTGSTSNLMGARDSLALWMPSTNVLWIFGGWGFADRSSTARGKMRDLWKFDPSTLQWTWLSGTSAHVSLPIYGTQGVAAATNNPGVRQQRTMVADNSGNLWAFGGYGVGIYDSATQAHNDLWKYNISTGQWTWMSGGNQDGGEPGVYGTKGVANAANVPGGRMAHVMAYDSVGGNLWIFGGYGVDSVGGWGDLSDLWKYNIASGQWTWMAGPTTNSQLAVWGTKGTANAANYPSAREGAGMTVDPSGNVWLLGGWGIDSTSTQGLMNDFWKFSGGQWTWVGGAQTAAQNGVYGTIKVASSSNMPGARATNLFSDSSGNIWLFGGDSYDSGGCASSQNDLWKYNPSTNQWMWYNGSSTCNTVGVYGILGTGNTLNHPGARSRAGAFMDSNGKIWIYSSWGFDTSSQGYLGDLWKFDPSNDSWTWMSGAKTVNPVGTYGTLGVMSPTNTPGGRNEIYSATMDSSNNIWVFGGVSLDVNGTLGNMGDLWKYKP